MLPWSVVRRRFVCELFSDQLCAMRVCRVYNEDIQDMQGFDDFERYHIHAALSDGNVSCICHLTQCYWPCSKRRHSVKCLCRIWKDASCISDYSCKDSFFQPLSKAFKLQVGNMSVVHIRPVLIVTVDPWHMFALTVLALFGRREETRPENDTELRLVRLPKHVTLSLSQMASH